MLLAGGYLFAIGLLAQLIAFLGGAGSFKTQALLVLLGIAGLAILLLSERLRQRIQRFVSRHFKRPQHDFRKVWLLFTQRTSGVIDRDTVCATAAKLISETFNVLSVTIWRVDEGQGKTRLRSVRLRWLPATTLELSLRSVMPPRARWEFATLQSRGAEGGMGGKLQKDQLRQIPQRWQSNLPSVIGRRSMAWMCDSRRSSKWAFLHHRGTGSAQVHG